MAFDTAQKQMPLVKQKKAEQITYAKLRNVTVVYIHNTHLMAVNFAFLNRTIDNNDLIPMPNLS